jgi:DNA-directed RNA polymerase specialized sigma54-like protein
MSDSKLVMTPMLQMAIRMLQLDQDELFAMIAAWRAAHPGAIADLAPGEAEPVSEEEQTAFEEEGVPIWTYLDTPPLPEASPRADVWVFGNPPQVRANPGAVPRVRAVFDDATMSRSAVDINEAAWVARAVRQRAKSFERIVRALVALAPQLSVALEPDKLAGIDLAALAAQAGFHESTVSRIASVCRYQTIHGVVQLVVAKRAIKHRALW